MSKPKAIGKGASNEGAPLTLTPGDIVDAQAELSHKHKWDLKSEPYSHILASTNTDRSPDVLVTREHYECENCNATKDVEIKAPLSTVRKAVPRAQA